MLQIIKSVLFCSLLVLPLSCSRYVKPFTEISGETVYTSNGKETAWTGYVVVINHVNRLFMELGVIEDGKIDIYFPDIGSANNAESLVSTIDLGFPNIKVTPEDAEWLKIDDSLRMLVLTDEEGDNPFPSISNNNNNPPEKIKQNYILQFRNRDNTLRVVFTYFTKNVTVKGKGTYLGGTAYDIDIKASKGWNMIYVKESKNRVSMKSGEKNIKDIKWFADKTISDISPF
jgi:hypothetical protein